MQQYNWIMMSSVWRQVSSPWWYLSSCQRWPSWVGVCTDGKRRFRHSSQREASRRTVLNSPSTTKPTLSMCWVKTRGSTSYDHPSSPFCPLLPPLCWTNPEKKKKTWGHKMSLAESLETLTFMEHFCIKSAGTVKSWQRNSEYAKAGDEKNVWTDCPYKWFSILILYIHMSMVSFLAQYCGLSF